MARCRSVVVFASGVGALWLLLCAGSWADGAGGTGSLSRMFETPAAAAAGLSSPPAASEGWTSFSHWQRNANGSVTDDVFSAPIFSDAGGAWHRVDASVKASADHGGAVAGLVRPVQFGSDAAHLETLGFDAGPVTISAPQLTIDQPSMTSSSVRYSSVAPSTDLWYRVNAHAVVEALVLKSASSPTSFTFHISDPSHALGSLSTDGNGARFSALIDGDVSVGLAAPFAYQESSSSNPGQDPAVPVDPGSAHMTVSSAGDGWDVTESVDQSWLKGKSYPIVLDPTVTFDHASGTMIAGNDTYYPSGCKGGCVPNTTTADLSAGTYTDSTYDFEPARSVFRFDLSSIPGGSEVTSASLAEYTIGCLGNPNGGTYYCNQRDYTVELHQLDGPWTTSSTYDQIASFTDASAFSSLHQPAFSANFNPPCTSCFWANLDLTSQAQNWVNAPSTNYGFVEKLQTEPYSIGGPYWSYLGPQGGGNGYPAPYLSVTYLPNVPSGGETLGGSNPSEPGLTQPSLTCYPVDCATGDFYHSFTDLAIPGRGIPLDLARTYNSLAAATNGPFGYGWASSYDMSLAVDGSGNVTVSQENGSQVTFNPAPGGGYIAGQRVTATLVKNGDGSYTFTRGRRERFTFSSAGLLTGETDLNGYMTTLSYNGTQLATVTDPAGRTLSFAYGANGDVSSVTDSGGRRVSYGYDSSGNLTSVVDAGGGTTSFTYDANHLLLSMTDPRGGTTTNTYDASARVTAQVDPMNRRTTFSYGTSSTTVTDPNGNVDVQNYANGLLTSLTRGSGTPQAATWTYGYQSPTLAATSITDPNGHTSRATYDAQANLLTKTNGLGRTTTFTYDSVNDLTSIKDALGHTTTLAYDANGNLLSKSRPVTETSQTALTTYAYGDSAHPGDVTSITDPTGAVWSYTYDAYGNRIKRVDPLGNTTTTTFDSLGRPTATVSPKGNVQGADPANFTTSYTYNAFGDVLTQTDPLGDKTVNTYDAGRNLISTKDPDGHTTSYAYNADNELTSITRANGSVTGYGYDGDGNRTSWTDPNGNITSYTYDPLDRQVSITDPLGRITARAYDGAGNLVSVTDPSNQTATYTYDAGDQLLEIAYSDGNTPNVAFSYNADGQVASEVSNSVSRDYTYDSLNRLAKTINEATVVSAVSGPITHPNVVTTDVTYGYDLASQFTSLSVDLGAAGVEPIVTRTFTRTYDAAGEMTAVSDGLGHTTTFAYDPNHNNVSETYPNGTLASYHYDNADRLSQIQDSGPSGVFLSLSYTRDANDLVTKDDASGTSGPNLSNAYDTANRLSSSTPVSNGSTNSYGYDPADNRTSWTTTGGSNTYAYDKANELTSASLFSGARITFASDSRGNRVTESDSAGNQITYGYDQANRLVSYRGPTVNKIDRIAGVAVQQTRYAYDASGLRTDLAWDLVEGIPLIIGDATQNAYLTGPDGLPVERIDPKGDVAYYHHDQLGSTRALTGSNGSVVITYTYDPYGNVTPSNTTDSNPFQFAGQYTDVSTGLIYMRARWYDPTTGQFLSTDPAAAATNEIYAFADDDPINAIDPTGLCSAASDGVPNAASLHRCGTADVTGFETVHGFSIVTGKIRAPRGAMFQYWVRFMSDSLLSWAGAFAVGSGSMLSGYATAHGFWMPSPAIMSWGSGRGYATYGINVKVANGNPLGQGWNVQVDVYSPYKCSLNLS